MTLTKAISELIAEMYNPNLSEVERSALQKYRTWLFSIKTTVTNNKEPWHRTNVADPREDGTYIITRADDGTTDVGLYTEGVWSTLEDPIAWMPLPEPYDGE